MIYLFMISSNDLTGVQDFSDCVEYKDNFIPLTRIPVRMRVIKRARPRRQHRCRQWVVRGNLKRDEMSAILQVSDLYTFNFSYHCIAMDTSTSRIAIPEVDKLLT